MMDPARQPSPSASFVLGSVVALTGCFALWGSAQQSSMAAPQAPAPGPAVAHSETCARCHENSSRAIAMRDSRGQRVAPFDLWRSTMMANSARDPFWRAVMSAEISSFPTRRHEIESKCLKCHTPLADRAGLDDHGSGSVAHLLDCDSELGRAARDGVSCTICHGMSPEGLGTAASFTAGFELDPYRRLFGPHAEPATGPMRMNTGFTPAAGEHLTDSALCGSCHTLVTHALAPDGSDTGIEFHEQTPYLEWRNSAFDLERELPGPRAASCQDCHVPTSDEFGVPISTRLATNPGGRDFGFLQERSPYGRHLFVGGNTLVLSLFRDHGEELGVSAPREAFAATLAATRRQLSTRTASLEVSALESAPGSLAFEVHVENLSGHKFPTGHPSRRAWLHVSVLDAQGVELAASGAWDEGGRLVGPDGLPLATEFAGGPIEPHRNRVQAPEQVARFRTVLADAQGEPTFRLLAAAGFEVDDRLLPAGWSATHPDAAATRPIGVEGDPDFRAGADGIGFQLSFEGLAAELLVELCYQPVSPRWVAELETLSTPEIQRFLALRETADRAPVIVSAQRLGLNL